MGSVWSLVVIVCGVSLLIRGISEDVDGTCNKICCKRCLKKAPGKRIETDNKDESQKITVSVKLDPRLHQRIVYPPTVQVSKSIQVPKPVSKPIDTYTPLMTSFIPNQQKKKDNIKF